MATRSHVVKAGDTLGHIAQRHGISLAALLKANTQIKDPNRIRVGDRITIPQSVTKPSPAPKPKAVTRVVQPGDSLSKIAATFGVTVAQLLAANPDIKDPDRIHPGQVIASPPHSRPKKATGPAQAPTRPDSPVAAKDWTKASGDARMRHVMRRLVDRYGYPVDAAAGIVGNLWAESGCLPPRLEGSASATPLRAKDFAGKLTDFTPEQIMERDSRAKRGPKLPGIGLAQWTEPTRRAGLFRHTFKGRVLAASIIYDMEAQVDYLVAELRSGFKVVNRVLSDPAVTANVAADEVVYNFEVPGSVLRPTAESGSRKLPREDPRVQSVFKQRRGFAQKALKAFRDANA